MKSRIKKLFPEIIRFWRLFKFEFKKREKINRTNWGFLFAGNKLMSTGLFETKETKLIRKLLKDVDLFINIGANIGYYCCHALNLGKKVIAFEPMPNNLYFLYKNIEINNWNNSIQVFPVGLGNKNGIEKIYGDNTGASLIKGWGNFEETFQTNISCFKADTLLQNIINNKKCLFLIDVEGFEYDVLLGAKSLISMDNSPVWIIEIMMIEYHSKGKPLNTKFIKTFDLFYDNSYKVYDIENNLKLINREFLIEKYNSKKYNSINFLIKK